MQCAIQVAGAVPPKPRTAIKPPSRGDPRSRRHGSLREQGERAPQHEERTLLPSTAKHVQHRFGAGPARREQATVRGGGLPEKNASLDPVKEISCADKARLIAGLRRHYKLADLLQVASLARSRIYCQCQ